MDARHSDGSPSTTATLRAMSLRSEMGISLVAGDGGEDGSFPFPSGILVPWAPPETTLPHPHAPLKVGVAPKEIVPQTSLRRTPSRVPQVPTKHACLILRLHAAVHEAVPLSPREIPTHPIQVIHPRMAILMAPLTCTNEIPVDRTSPIVVVGVACIAMGR